MAKQLSCWEPISVSRSEFYSNLFQWLYCSLVPSGHFKILAGSINMGAFIITLGAGEHLERRISLLSFSLSVCYSNSLLWLLNSAWKIHSEPPRFLLLLSNFKIYLTLFILFIRFSNVKAFQTERLLTCLFI